MWSFVGSKREAWWVWVALDAATRQVLAIMVGGRTKYIAGCLWEALPEEYRAGAIILTDFWAASRGVIPATQHIECGKGDWVTNHVERFWCTVRQRCSRFVRKSLSFSKCDTNHIGPMVFHPPLQRVSTMMHL